MLALFLFAVRDPAGCRCRNGADDVIEKRVDFSAGFGVELGNDAGFQFIHVTKIGQSNAAVYIDDTERQDFIAAIESFIIGNDAL